jgi:signal transduction histidine kinase
VFGFVRNHSITKHWLVNSLGIVIAVLLVVDVMGLILANSYYKTTIRQYLTSKLDSISSDLLKYQSSSGFRAEVRDIIEKFDEKDKYELMAVSSTGRATLTSSGFAPSDWMNLDDYREAKNSEERCCYRELKLESGERVMSYIVMLSGPAYEYSALRIMTSMDAVHNQMIKLGILFSAIMLAIILLMFVSGLYFIRSIVLPVRRMCETARSYAEGDFRERIEKVEDDEIGELADAINYMASELESSDKMKNEFISSVSHELRTPLTAIKGWSETALQMPDDPETVGKAMRVITGETERLSDMVEELLDFSRIQDGRFTLQIETCDILAELGDAVLIYTERAKALGIELKYYEPEMLPFVHGDRARLRQVFINIIDNAVKYSNPGGVVSVEAYEKKGDIVVLISDTGVGISAEDLPKVKTKFYKANQTRRGSGIGLAVADEIVNMHGGSLIVNSKLGTGTTVMITLPGIQPGGGQK